MIINSYEFIFFFAIAFSLHWALPLRWRIPLLLGASYIFYGLWDPRFLLLIALATAVDYSVGRCLAPLVPQASEHPAHPAALASLTPTRPALVATWGRTLGGFLAAIACIALILPWPNSNGSPLAWQEFFASITTPLPWLGVIGFGLLGWLLGSGLPHLSAGQPQSPAQGSNLVPNLVPNLVQRKRLLLLSLFTNLGILGCFKYFNFFADSVEALFQGLGWNVDLVTLQLLLPIGISFYSFKTLGYVIDVYRGKQQPETQLLDYALFLAFFPALLAGPIDRASSFLPQLKRRPQLSLERLGSGLVLILLGLFKKMAIADGVAPSVSAIYQGNGTPSWLDVVLATLLYAIQIYGDFSGYTDMARGVAKLLGLDLAINFNLPYFSQNPSEFWRRWHISLSTWLRDYLYISLGGNRQGNLRTYFNLMATMVLGGLWHGATWNFGLWGAYQGAILCIHRWFSLRQSPLAQAVPSPPTQPRLALHALWKIPLFFIVTCYGWLLFGVADFNHITHLSHILLTDFGDFSLTLPMPRLAALLGIPLLFGYEALDYLSQTTPLKPKRWPICQGMFYAALIFIALMGSSNEPAQFIYTQF